MGWGNRPCYCTCPHAHYTMLTLLTMQCLGFCLNTDHRPCLEAVLPPIINQIQTLNIQPLHWLSVMLLSWEKKEKTEHKGLKTYRGSSNRRLLCALANKMWLWRKICIFLLVHPVPLQVAVRASNKSDQRYGNAFERKWLHFQFPRSCVQQMHERDICVMSWTCFWTSLLQTVNTRSGRAHHLLVLEARLFS